jgi:uncharacterized damage-inducible protein DinB
MGVREALLPEFDHEMANTRKTLERVPADRFAWKPHAKSWNMGGLATHVANIPSWAPLILEKDSFDIAPPGQPRPRAEEAKTVADLLAMFDKNVAAARAAIAAADDAKFFQPWTLLSGGNKVFTLPKAACVRSFVMNHGIHHRAQLGVYLRLNDVPVPAIYGPSADESPF